MSRNNKHLSVNRIWDVGRLTVCITLAAASLIGGSLGQSVVAQTPVAGLSSDWVDGHASRVRMLAGRSSELAASRPRAIIAGVEIALQPGWKTYWKFPGEDGGIPPQFDWSKSKNVADAKVIFPAPTRLLSATGESIGYKDGVVLPVIVTAMDASKPIELLLDVAYGVCSDICIRAEASLNLGVPQDLSQGLPPQIEQALDQSPRAEGEKRAEDPKITAFDVVLSGKSPRVVLDVDFGSEPEKGDVFGTAPSGLYLPMPQRDAGESGKSGLARFVIDLTKTIDLDDLKGKSITLTLVGANGQSEQKLRLE